MKKEIKVKLKSSENNIEFLTTAIYDEDLKEYKYIDNDEFKTIVKFNLKDYTLTRKNDNIKLRYHFDKEDITKGEIEVLELNTTIDVEIKTKELIIEDNIIDIKYEIEKEEFNYIIEVK